MQYGRRAQQQGKSIVCARLDTESTTMLQADQLHERRAHTAIAL
jgi:hypothetical protein